MNKNAFRQLSYGVYIVSTWDEGRATGCTANSAMQITSDPATIAVSINHDNYTNVCIQKLGKFAISILGEHSDPGTIGVFGFQSGRDNNKFDQIKPEIRGYMPVIPDACAYIVCEVVDKLETSSHTVFLGKVVDADILREDDPMTYAYYHNVIKGKSPKTAPTYIAEEPQNEEKATYVCGVCGYEYQGEVPFEELPEDYVCPVCKQPKSVFQKK
ncbi:MAG: flavin reductase [Lachnospiraceae bacterium]|nr:flavin reductase [Lachnospiraceae bacterium]